MSSEIDALAKLARANVEKMMEKESFLPPDQMAAAAQQEDMMAAQGMPPGGGGMPPGMDPSAMMGGSVPQAPGMEQLPPPGMPPEGAMPPEGGSGGEATTEDRLTNIEMMLEQLMGALGLGEPASMGESVPTEPGGGPPMPEEVMPGAMAGMDPSMMGGGMPPGMDPNAMVPTGPMQVAASDTSPTAKMAAVMSFVNGLQKRV